MRMFNIHRLIASVMMTTMMCRHLYLMFRNHNFLLSKTSIFPSENKIYSVHISKIVLHVEKQRPKRSIITILALVKTGR